MSFLAEILSCAEKVELEEINKNVPELVINIGNVKSEVMNYIENVYIKYSSRPKQIRRLLNTAREIENEMKTLRELVDHAVKKGLDTSLDELEKYTTSLYSVNFSLQVTFTLCHLNESLLNIEDLLQSRQYFKCIELICNTLNLIDETPTEERVEVFSNLRAVINKKKANLLKELEIVFANTVTIIINEDNSATMKIKKDTSDLEEALITLFYNSPVLEALHSLAKSLWNFFFIPVVDYTVKVTIVEETEHHLMNLTIIDTSEKSHYAIVFSNLKTILEFLKEQFNLKVNDNMTTLQYVGIDIRDNLSELIIKHCLQDTVPSTAEELQKYKIVIDSTNSLEKILLECGIFAVDTTSIYDYANNVDVLYITKKCQEYLISSKWIMKKDLHDMMEVGVPYNMNSLLSGKVDEFLQCSVSKNVNELLEFAEKIIQQTLTASNACAHNLFGTVQNIFRTYSKFVPEFHKKFLQTIPQQVAVFYNNCLYISFKLGLWNVTYSLKLRAVLNDDNCGFQTEVLHLQKVAHDTFSVYVEGQINQINEIMKEAGLNGPALEKIQPVTEKSIRQCLRQQELLKTVWHKVLSYPVYNQTIGVILNSLCNCIINAVTKFEDISSNAAEHMVDILKIVLTRGPKLFTDPKEVNLYVSSWYKLNELHFIFAASLIDINDRWADGKGPLALQFEPRELKQLIRALFQNTDRRSAILAKI